MSEERTIRVEEVDSVAPPPKARAEDAGAAPETMGAKLGRKRDYLEGFLAEKPAAADPQTVGGDLYEAVVAALKDIYDPEIRSEEHTSELQSLMRHTYAVFRM